MFPAVTINHKCDWKEGGVTKGVIPTRTEGNLEKIKHLRKGVKNGPEMSKIRNETKFIP